MTFERQKKFLFISSKFQTPTDKVIKVSAETEGAQYLGEEEGVGGVLGLICFLPNSSPTNLALSVNYRVGGIYASHYQTLWGILIAVQLLPVCASPPCLSQMCHCTLLICFICIFLCICICICICTSVAAPLVFLKCANAPPPMCFQLIWGWTSPCHLRALLCQILGLPPMTMISWKWCKQTHWCYESVSEIGVLRCFR